ncbi:long-chain-fatty-acid--CoA ligase [Alkalihalobacterium chitinilyticum]|uniref:Long-chain-fatty-acid--CoA ligase n=1 Tax=Alkalihalobacterium chitinilyticum TaxID=2980103 RepID=A0ABT5VII4_9BACI|nr:long-chain-fatty-acid--CoA ligase [Alkalihalobacterium chitinilyticum]MDE5415065.1 long-chain-fatty-acid--CoA ligase [Alkalihalobacterium chitinilyticum]
MNLYSNLTNALNLNPDKEAYIFLNESTTYRELHQKVNQFAHSLSQQGIEKGDTVALLLGNTPEFVVAYYGTICAGATVVPVNPTFTAREIEYILTNSKAKGVIADASLHTPLTEVRQKVSSVDFVVYTKPVESELAFESFIDNDVQNFNGPVVEENDVAVILYTSGTTGAPKGVMLTHKNLQSNAEAVKDLFEMTAEDRVVTVLPIFHVFCMTVCFNAPILSGSTMILLPKFSPQEVVETFVKEQATVFAGVPTMFNFLLQIPTTKEQFSSLRICISGGSSLPVAVLNKFQEHSGIQIQEGYGLSEAAPVTAFNPLRGVCKPGSIGVNIPYVENKVVDPEGEEVPRGEVGELIVKGPNVMKGYLGMPEETARSIKDGWLYTGDMATMDEEGYIYIVDRKKDMIIVGGYNVYPREIEEVLYDHADIVEVAVIGVPDESYGESVKAFVVSKNETLTESDLKNYLADKLVKYKRPQYIEFLSELPKNTTGKILRKNLRNLEHSTK